ncbi:GntR family transcriptional regulator [Desulfosediminicola flagellatus]|uniref:GntR family transcriptional regulator n=1 Tax=Desulfosediminicola flagellatus TaxID=2569541 RepID=UPI0010AD064F|nr:GntR family transcriptional regulator [Desulfosediminicola flagellatus]
MGKMVVKRESLTEQIKSILIDRIVDGTLVPGDRLKELQIASEFGTSQAPVREAIRSLQALGYVEHKPHVGALVKTFTKKEIEEAYQVREALEGHCLILADLNTEQLVQQLNIHLESMHQAVIHNDVRRFTKADNRFHQAIVEFSGNETMLKIWGSLRMQLQVIATLVEASMPLESLYALHPPIIAVLERNHREGAARFLADHYRQIGNYWK